MPRSPLAPAFALALLAACGGESAESAAESASDAMQQAADAMQRAADDMAGSSGDAPEPMTAEEMQDALPEELAGLPRMSTERQSVGAAGFGMAQAQATYEGEGRSLEVEMMSGTGILAGPAMAFSMVDFDRTTETGWERTIEHDGMKGMQEYEERGDTPRATMMVLVHDRLLVRLEAEGMSMEQVEDAFDELDVG